MSKAIQTTNPNPEWAKILTLLAYNNSNDYLSASQMVLHHDKIEIPFVDLSSDVQTPEFEDKAAQARALLSAKQAVPIATGIYGYVSGDIQSAYQLSSLADVKTASGYVGENLAPTVSRSAIAGLAVASANSANKNNQDIAALTQGLFAIENEKTAKVLSNQEFAFTNKETEESARKAASVLRLTLNKYQATFMNKIYDQVKEKGLDDFVQNGVK